MNVKINKVTRITFATIKFACSSFSISILCSVILFHLSVYWKTQSCTPIFRWQALRLSVWLIYIIKFSCILLNYSDYILNSVMLATEEIFKIISSLVNFGFGGIFTCLFLKSLVLQRMIYNICFSIMLILYFVNEPIIKKAGKNLSIPSYVTGKRNGVDFNLKAKKYACRYSPTDTLHFLFIFTFYAT